MGLRHKCPNKKGGYGANDPVEEEEEMEAEGVDDGGHQGGEEHHGAATHQLGHRGAHVPVVVSLDAI